MTLLDPRWMVGTLALLGALHFGGCAKVDVDQVKPGRDSEQKVKTLYGAPSERIESSLKPGAVLLKYGPDHQFQIEKGVVTATVRISEPKEQTLQYWRHRWRGQDQTYEPITTDSERHGPRAFALRAPKLGMAVLYDPQLDRVTKVVRYGSR